MRSLRTVVGFGKETASAGGSGAEPTGTAPDPALKQPRLADEVAADPLVVQAAEAWLGEAGGWFRPLPRVLMAAFDADTRQARSRQACIIGVLGAAVGISFYPTLAAIAPSVLPSLNRLFLGMAVPVTFLSSLLVLLDLPPRVRELVLAVPSMLSSAVITCLFIWSHAPITEIFVTGMILMMLFATVTMQLRFEVAVLTVAVIMALFAAGVESVAGLVPAYRQALDMIGLGCAGYMLVANWRSQTEQQHNYVLTLRERQRRHALARQNLALNALAWSDALTGIANRHAYESWLQSTWANARQAGETLGLIMIDVDHFKSYNDTYGHPAGDRCLRQVADCLREQLRGTTDLLARVGGEEFAVILPRATPDICGQVAARLRDAVAMLGVRNMGGGPAAIVTVSCGCASGMADVPALCAAADSALYSAKQAGRNRVCVAGARKQVIVAVGEQE
jgi:diguanylate cyclase (GGDEF)-like protein